MTKACTYTSILYLYILNWQQFIALITKEKFSAKKQANFDFKDNIRDNIKNELDLVALAELSNHIYYMFNYTYTEITILTISTLLYWNY